MGELELEGKTLTERSGSSCPPARGAPATMAGGGGKHLERMSLEQGSLAVSSVAPLTVAAAVTTASLLTTTDLTATSRTGEDSTTRASTARAFSEPGLQQPEQPSLPMRLQPNVPGPERKHPRRLPAQRQHGEDLVLHHRVEQQLWRPADLEEISKQPLVLHGLQQSRTMRNVKSVIFKGLE